LRLEGGGEAGGIKGRFPQYQNRGQEGNGGEELGWDRLLGGRKEQPGAKKDHHSRILVVEKNGSLTLN